MTSHVAVLTVALLAFSEFTVAITGRSRPDAQEHEASTALDSEDLEPILVRV
jgi:hypothetical protein